jgi:hypothetical protein
MAAPANAAYVKKALANSEPSTHGTNRTSRNVRSAVANAGIADMAKSTRMTDTVEKGLVIFGEQ